MQKGSVRKVRSDKKREVKAVLTIELKDAIYRLSYITYTPVKDVCERLCMYVLDDQHAIEQLSHFFKRDVRIGHTIYMGHATNKTVTKRFKGITSKVTVRFKQNLYNNIAALSYAFDCTPSRTVALILNAAMRNSGYVNQYIHEYLDGKLTENQMHELRGILKYVNHTSDAKQSWMALLGHIMDEVSAPVSKVKDVVSEFLSNIKDKDK